jgi:hypothetical protein
MLFLIQYREITQAELAKALGIRVGVGMPFSRVKQLEQWHIQVEVEEWSGIDGLNTAFEHNKAIIVALVTTPGLPGGSDIWSLLLP